MTCFLTRNKFECRVSSVLNKDNKNYGKKHMFDNNPETCWNSDAGTPQWILLNFDNECELFAFEIIFQGGFAGKVCNLEGGNCEKNTETIESFYPEDINSPQKFILKKSAKAKCFKFVFNESTDFFGRIIIYKLSLYS